MASLIEMKQLHREALTKADGIITAAENGSRALTDAEAMDVDAAMAEAQKLAPQIANSERKNTLRGMLTNGALVPNSGAGVAPATKKVFSRDYLSGFHAWVASGGQSVSAALYEGSGPSGGFSVPVVTDGQIVPLAPLETGIRRLAMVVPTSNDIKIPYKATAGTAAAKAESGATINTFTESEATLGQFTLSAYMAGIVEKVSFELAQDQPAFQAFAVSDMLNAQQQFEGAWYINGTGVNQPQGVIGNVGAGVTAEPDAAGNLVSLDGTLDLIGTLNAQYHEGASFLMARPTSIILRKAQRQANLFEPSWTRSNGTDYLYGYPVGYSSAMPAAARGACPVLFGDFKQGYVIGERGGAGINVKILDQPFALQGQVALLGYRRTDGRVRRSEAIQSYNIAGS